METLKNILLQLADGRFHSGTQLAATLGLSRTAIWKQIQQLTQQYNIAVQAVQGRGYRLEEPLELLDAARIRAAMSQAGQALLQQLEICWSIPSSSRYLMEQRLRELASGTVVVAEHQTAGRGRRGRDWVSPFGTNLYFSCLWHFNRAPADLGGLSLVIAVVILRVLHHMGIDGLGLKWPNDILWQNRKLCGVLLEMQGEASGPSAVVIGIGLNVNMPAATAQAIDQPWVDLRQLSAGPVSRNELLGRVLDALLPALREFDQQGLMPFLADWQKWDILAGQEISLHFPDRIETGRALGIDPDGGLRVQGPAGSRSYHAGEVSLRKREI